MAQDEFFGYSPKALRFNPVSNSFSMHTSYNSLYGQVFFKPGKNSPFANSSEQNDVAVDRRGNLIRSGQIENQPIDEFIMQDGSRFALDRVTISGVLSGYVASQPLQPGVCYRGLSENAVQIELERQLVDDVASSGESGPTCFGPGTMITTEEGEVPVEWLDTSDRVLTRDHGFQPILWIGRTRRSRIHFQQFPEDCPVQIPAGSLGPNVPGHDLSVTGDQRILLRCAMTEKMFFSSEVFAPANAWVDVGQASTFRPSKAYTLTQILCASHEIILAEGVWVETMLVHEQARHRLCSDHAKQLKALLGADMDPVRAARPCLSSKEAVMLLSEEMQEFGEMNEAS